MNNVKYNGFFWRFGIKKLFTSLLFITTTSNAQILPLPSEKLSKPYPLSGYCKNMKLVEFRGVKNTTVNKNYISATCDLGAVEFYKFMKLKKFKIKESYPSFNISLIPMFGKRSLNDHYGRFLELPKFCGRYGEVCKNGQKPWNVYGYTLLHYNHLFVHSKMFTNGKFTKYFAEEFVHEIFHVFSYSSGLRAQHKNPVHDDEVLVNEFINWIDW